MRAKLDSLVLPLLADSVGVLDLVSNLRLTTRMMNWREESRARVGTEIGNSGSSRQGRVEERGEAGGDGEKGAMDTSRSAHYSRTVDKCSMGSRDWRRLGVCSLVPTL